MNHRCVGASLLAIVSEATLAIASKLAPTIVQIHCHVQ